MESGPIKPWTREKSAIHADCHVYRILKERWSNRHHQSEGDFYVMDVGDWAVCIAMTEANKVVLVKQFRFGTEDFSWELPAGVVDPGEEPEEGALRELYEESGYASQNPVHLGTVHPNPAVQRNRCHFILARSAYRKDSGNPGPHEFFEVQEVSVDELFSWARKGKITHAIVHAALFFLRDFLDESGQSLKPSAEGGR